MTDWYGPDAATFGDRVAAAREAAGMNQVALATRLGIRETTLRKWENDVSEPRANRLSMLSGVLNVSMRWLITGEGDGIEPPDGNPATTQDIRDILSEMRSMRAELHAKAEAIGRLEKRVRLMMQDGADA